MTTRVIAPVSTGANKDRSYNGDYMARGKEAEEKVLAWLKDQPSVIGIEDWRELRAVHEADIDCSIKTIDGRVTLAEIKSDSHLGVTPNVLFEVLRINHTCTPDRAVTLDWSARSPATYFLFYAPSVNRIYQCRADDLRKAVQTYSRNHRGQTRSSWVSTDAIKSTLNLLIPWEACEKVFTIHELEDPDDLPF